MHWYLQCSHARNAVMPAMQPCPQCSDGCNAVMPGNARVQSTHTQTHTSSSHRLKFKSTLINWHTRLHPAGLNKLMTNTNCIRRPAPGDPHAQKWVPLSLFFYVQYQQSWMILIHPQNRFIASMEPIVTASSGAKKTRTDTQISTSPIQHNFTS